MQKICMNLLIFTRHHIQVSLTCQFLLTIAFLTYGQNDSVILKSNVSIFNNMVDSIIKDAIAMNPSLKAAEFKMAASKSAVGTIKLAPPLVAVEFFQSPITSFPNPFKDQMEIDYSILQEFPFPGKLRSMVETEKNRSLMFEMDQQTTKQELIRLIRSAFYELYLIDRRLEINSSSQVLVKNFIDIAQKQYELGIGRQTDILRAQSELSKLLNDSISLIQNRQSTVAMINAYRNKPVATLIPAIPEIAPETLNNQELDSLLSIAYNNRSELKSMHYNVSIQSSELVNAKKELYPDFMIRGMYKQMIKQKDDWALMVGATIPVAPWSIGKYSAAVKRSSQLINQAQSEYDNMRNMIASQVRDAQSRVINGQAQIELILHTTIPQARQTMQSALAGYQNGKQDFLMLLDTQRMLFMAQLDYHMAVMNIMTNQANLERAIGLLK